MKTKSLLASLLVFCACLVDFHVRGQLVADGGTTTVDATTSTNIVGELTIGTNGSFTSLIITNGGTVTNDGRGIIGYNSTAQTNSVTITSSDSRWHIGDQFYIGFFGSFSQLVVSNGGVAMTDIHCLFGVDDVSSNNTAVVTGTNSLLKSSQTISVGSHGSFNLLLATNGGSVESLFGELGSIASSSNNLAIVTGPGSLWTIDNALIVGKNGSYNKFAVLNGGNLVSDSAVIGGDFANTGIGSHNLAVVSDTNSVWSNFGGFLGNLHVGNVGSFNQLVVTNGGTVVNDGSVNLGYVVNPYGTGSRNSMVITGTNSLFANGGAIRVGNGGDSNQLIVTNGGKLTGFSSVIGNNTQSSNNLALVTGSGSLWTNRSSLIVGNFGSANTLMVNNAGSVVATDLWLGFDSSSSNNTVTLSGGNIIVSNASGTGVTDVRRGTLTLNSGRLLTDSLLLTNGTQSVLAFNGGTLQTGSTTNSNGSPFVVGDGASPATFELLGNGTHSFANGLQIANNALLKGNGTVNGDITNFSGGTLSPGASIGRLNVSGNLVLAAGSTNVFELNKTLGTNDNITSQTAVTYGGTLVVTNLAGTLINGTSFKLFTAANYSGQFNALSAPSPGAGLKWNLNRLSVDGVLRVVSNPTAPPSIAGTALLNGTNLVINAIGGVSYDPVYLLTATNVALPITNWVYLATNYFDSLGNAGISNGISPGEPQRYFRLRVE